MTLLSMSVKNVHGATPTSLPKGGLLENLLRIKRANEGLAQRWKEKHALFQDKKWNGGHDVGPEPDNSLLRPLVKSGLRPYTNVRNAAYVCRLRTCFFTPVNLLRVPSPV